MHTKRFMQGGGNSEIEQSQELHHYTSLAGLKGIFETQTLWATHFSSMNDSSEGQAFRECLFGPLSEWLADNLNRSRTKINFPLKDFSGKPSEQVQLVAQSFIDNTYSAIIGQQGADSGSALASPYILSFCNHSQDQDYEKQNGLLSQWRGYAGSGGYCIVFDRAGLDEGLTTEFDKFRYQHAPMGDVIYSDNAEGIKFLVAKIVPALEAMHGMKNVRRLGLLPLMPFIVAAIITKHRGFKEEREWRFAATPEQIGIHQKRVPSKAGQLKEIKTRLLRDKEVKYLAVFEGQDKPLPVRRIIVGPSVDQSKNIVEARRVVGNGVPIVRSATPFV